MTAAIKLAVCLQKWLQQVHMSHVMSPGKTTICLKAIFTQQNSSINFVSCPFRDLLVTCPLTFLVKKTWRWQGESSWCACVCLYGRRAPLYGQLHLSGRDPQDEKMPQDETMSKSLEMVMFSWYVRLKVQFREISIDQCKGVWLHRF